MIDEKFFETYLTLLLDGKRSKCHDIVQRLLDEKSTGLGMLITRKVIEAHGGKIWIDSSVGEGTTVYFKIPIQKG